MHLLPHRRTLPAALASLLLGATAAGQAPLELHRGDTLCLVGNALAERMQHHGWLEARLQRRLPDHELSVRNLGFAADELAVHQRTMNFGKFSSDGMAMDLRHERFVPWDRYLEHCGADVVLAFFGYNESFGGEAGLPAFREQLESFVEHVLDQRYDGQEPPALVLCGSIPHEDLGRATLPDGHEHNARIERYNAVMAEVAAAAGVPYVDLYGPMAARYAASDEPLTINGIHLTERGNAALAEVIEAALLPMPPVPVTATLERLRAAVIEKNRLWFERYRATDGYNVYGGRSRQVYAAAASGVAYSNFDVLQREMDHLDALVARRDRGIWALARGEEPPAGGPELPPLIRVETNKLGPGPRGEHLFVDALDALDAMTPAPGMEVSLFADERRFPELVNPVQMAWDTRGRLWVAVWPTYPHWTPDRPMDDKLLVLEDTDGDGRADECTVFADDLHNPTGFEFWDGGVFVAGVPDLLFLEDTDGDGRADRRERVLHGLSSADTHHSANSFVMGPDGALYFQEGTFHMSQVESIYGPVRNQNGCVWRFEPRTWRVERYVPYNFANPHGHVFDRWGQDFVTDGTGNVNYYALPFSGHLPQPLKQRGYFPFFQQRSRPAGGTEILSSSHFPAENQGSYLIANVIGFQGIFQYEVVDDGAGFGAVEREPIVQSTDRNFRPVDLEVGPDGALYFVDWHNPLIGHLQHHLRDPSRDATHGRVYRVAHGGRPPLEPAPIAGQPDEALLELLRSPDDRVRYRTRIELSDRDPAVLLPLAREWARGLDAEDPELEHHLLEALWLHQQHGRMDRELLLRLLEARDPRARAAATRVLRYGRQHVPDALALLAERARDEHPRVRLEAVVGASFFDSAQAAAVALEALRRPTDRFLDHALEATLRGLEPHWKAALRAGEGLAADNPVGIHWLLERVEAEELVNLPRLPTVLHALLTRHGVPREARLEAAASGAAQAGSTPAAELLAAVAEVDAAGGAHAAHVLMDLSGLLLETVRVGQGPPRAGLAQLAEHGRLPAARALGYAALIAHDGSVERAWERASASQAGLLALLGGLAQVEEAQRAALGARIRPLMFTAPAQLAGDAPAPGTGLDVHVYLPPPPDARRETLAGLTPAASLVTPGFTLDLPPVRAVDGFGLCFEGTLFVPEAGRYTFSTRSDDGSRLYVGERCVVDNDGDHGMRAAEGAVELTAGPHRLLVTFYDQGGAEGLAVTWAGPGFDAQPIGAEALGRGAGGALRAAAIRAMAHVPGRGTQKLSDAARLVADASLLEPTAELLRSVPRDERDPAAVRGLLDTLAASVAGLPAEARTEPAVMAALEVGRELARALPAEDAAAAVEQLDGLGGAIVLIRTLPHRMLYDVTEFWVGAGQPVSIVFQNNDVMPHNFVVTAPGEMQTVGQAAELLSGQPGAEARSFIPDSDAVLFHTRLLFPGQSERLTFVAPETPGDHPFVCTYPGHWRVMNGVMHVEEGLAGETRVARREGGAASGPARDFVQSWTLEDLAGLFTDGWERGRSAERGRRLFEEAGCIKCHTVDGQGAEAGPELTQIREKFHGLELLHQVLEPSHEVLEGYEQLVLLLDDGTLVTGRIAEDDGEFLHVLPSLLEPDNVVLVAKDEIEAQKDTGLSPMPTGLLVTLSKEEILDLLVFLQAPEDR